MSLRHEDKRRKGVFFGLMFHYKPQRVIASLHDINAILITGGVDAKLVSVGLEFVHHLAEGVIDAHHAQVFTLQSHEGVGRIGINRDGWVVVLADTIFTIMLFVLLGIHGLNDVFQRRRIDVAVGKGVIGTDEHDGGIVAYGDVLYNLIAATVAADGGILHTELVDPSMALVVMTVGRDFQEEHIVLVAAIETVGFNDISHGSFAVRVASKEEVDQHGLASVEDVIEVDLVAVDVDGGEVGHDFRGATGCGSDRLLDDFAEVAVDVGRHGINHVFRVRRQVTEGIGNDVGTRHAVSPEVFGKLEACDAHPFLDLGFGGHHVGIGGAVFIGREGGRDFGLQHLVDGDAHLRVIARRIAVMLLQAELFQSVDDRLGIVDGPQVLDDDGTIGGDNDESGIGTDLILVANRGATSLSTDGGVLHAVGVHPIETGGITVACGDFHIEHIMHVATHRIVGFHHFGRCLLAGATGGEEEVDKHILATVKDVEQVDFGAVNVSSREVDGLCERTLRFQAETEGQRENKGK